MIGDTTTAIVVPARDEERHVGRVIDSMPAWVDRIIVVDDGSTDATPRIVAERDADRVRLVRHGRSRGVGAAIVSGYRVAVQSGADVVVVMAGDGQMDPDDLEAVVGPVVRGEADYCKGNRLVHPEARRMPLARRAAGRVLAAATRVVTQLDVHDSQCGYTAITSEAIRRLPLDGLWPGYGYPNDLLALLAEHGCRVTEAPVRPIYADERSGVRPWHVLVIGALLTRAWRRRRAAGKRASRPWREWPVRLTGETAAARSAPGTDRPSRARA